MTLDESAHRLGACAWVEERLFEILGRWVRASSDDRFSLALATAARHHAAHSLQLRALLPETRDHDPGALVSPPPDGALADEGEWTAVAGSEDPASGFTTLRPMLAAHLTALESWLKDASPVRDGPGIRVVASVMAEDHADRGLLEMASG